MRKLFNFSAGPAVLPEAVLTQAAAEMPDWHGTGMSVMEMSHRGKDYMGIQAQAEADLRELLDIPAEYKVLFLAGGATLQFAALPLNLLPEGGSADYIDTGVWSGKAYSEAQRFGTVRLAASSKAILSLATRTRIWRAMLDPQDHEASYRHRIELQVACVRHVQHFWDSAFPGDNRVEEMLTLAQELIDQQADVPHAERRAKTFVMDVFDEVDDYNAITQPAVFVADAASSMVVSACSHNPHYDTADDTADDDELLPDSLETSYSCSGAAAGALNWQPIEETDVSARRAFWTWYLDEAIPQVLA